MKYALSFIFVLALTSLTSFGQTTSRKEMKEAWSKIPTNIEECMDRLEILFLDTTKEYFAHKSEEIAVAEFNMIQGMQFRNNWKLWRESVLSRYFNSYKIYHPEEMTYIIFTSYHRKLNNRPINFNEQIADHFAHAERLRTNPTKPTGYFKIGDTVYTNRFESGGIIKSMLGKQLAYEITAVVQAKDTTEQKLQLAVLHIRRMDTKEKQLVDKFVFDKQPIANGSIFWDKVTWWRKD
jgi:hypothetical protein